MSTPALTDSETGAIRAVAEVLIPGDGISPPSGEVDGYDGLVDQAARALGPELDDLRSAIASLPQPISWATLKQFADEQPQPFELVSTTATAAYFMSTTVLSSLGYPTGQRSAPPFDLAAEEIGSGITDPVLAHGSRVRPVV
jgi:hypothetical protein